MKEFEKNKNFEFIFGDIRNSKLTESLFKDVSDVVILVGLVGDPITKKYPEIAEEVNGKSLKNFINKCDGKKLNKVIFISTCSNYGLLKNDETADESHTLNPLSSYAKSKVEIEEHIISLQNKVDYSSTILRFATAFGLSSRMRFDLTVNQFTKEILNNNKLHVYDENTWRPYCHVNDFARLIEIVLSSKKDKTHFQIFNAGSDKNNFTKKEILKQITDIIPSDNFIFGKGGSDQRNYKVNFQKVKKILNFETNYSIQYGINEICNAIKSNLFNNFGIDINNLGNYKINLTTEK